MLPYMHVGMVGAGLLAIPNLRQPLLHRSMFAVMARNATCSAGVLVGMTVAAMCVAPWQPIEGGAMAYELGIMFAAMTWGMVASASLCRLSSAWRPRAAQYD
jgi:hypothetical protein